MAGDNKIVWSEGMFLRTQHFQQQDRWVEGLVRAAVRGLVGWGWGFRKLALNTGLLATGKVALAEADGVFQDGTPFAVPGGADHPEPLAIGEATREGLIFLTVVAEQPGSAEIDPETAPDTGARYRARAVEIKDAIAGTEARATIEIATPKLRLVHERDLAGGLIGLAVARVKGLEPDGSVVLDPDHIPPCLTIAAHPVFESFLAELEGKLETIATARVGYVVAPAARGSGEWQDLLVLELVNRAKPYVAHLHQQKTWHPERLFGYLVGLAGEMATYGTSERRPPAFPVYRHQDLCGCYRPVFDTLRRLLTELARPERKASPVPLKVHKTGIRTTESVNPQLFAEATFVLSVAAAMTPEKVRQQFPRLTTIAPAEEFPDLWNTRLRGIEVEPLPVAPRQIPFVAGRTYFELDRSSPYWKRLPRSNGLAIGVSGEWPELEIECWAIRD